MEALNYDVPPPNFLGNVGQGFGLGMGIQQAQQAQQAQQVALQQQQQQRQVLAALVANPNPTASDFAAATIAVPTLREHFKQAWDMHSNEQQQSALGEIGQVFASLANGQPEVGAALLDRRAEALKNSKGPADQIQAATSLAGVIRANPAFARALTGMKLASIPGGDKVLSSLSTLGTEQRAAAKAPGELLKINADASKAATEASVASATAPAAVEAPVLGNDIKREEIASAQVKRRLDQFDADIRAANSETQRGQLVLERDKFVADQALKRQGVASEAQNQMDTVQQSLRTVDGLMNHPGLEKATGLGGKIMGYIPGTEAKDFRAMVETLKSQEFLAAAEHMKGMGALSDAEGARLEKAVTSLDPDQSPGAFRTSLGVIRATLQRAQAKLVASGKLPTTGGAFVMTHPTLGTVTDGDVNRLLKKFPGASREQVMQYLQKAGAKPAGATGTY